MTRLTPIRVREVEEDADPQALMQAPRPAVEAKEDRDLNAFSTEMLLTALKALSQRTIVALSNLFTILTAGSAFYLWAVALPGITIVQIVGLTIYCTFILLLNIYGRRK